MLGESGRDVGQFNWIHGLACPVGRRAVRRRHEQLAGAEAAAAFERPGISESALVSRRMLEALEEWIGADAAGRTAARRHLRKRIRRQDSLIHAWVRLAPEPAGPLSEDEPLSGIPFGVKDIIDTAGLATEFGSPLYKGRQAPRRRDCQSAAARRRTAARENPDGGVRLPDAGVDPQPAKPVSYARWQFQRIGRGGGGRHGADRGRHPDAWLGAAAGIVLRRTGFKPTYGVLPMTACCRWRRASTRSVCSRTRRQGCGSRQVLGYSTGDALAEAAPFGVLDPLPDVEPAMVKIFGQTIARLRRRRVDLRPVAIVPMLDRLFRESRIVEQDHEGARVHQQRFEQYGDRLLDVADLVRAGRLVPEARYRAALAWIAECRAQMVAQYRLTPVILAPAATGAAPRGLASTGDPRLNSPWTAIGVPAISILIRAASGCQLDCS